MRPAELIYISERLIYILFEPSEGAFYHRKSNYYHKNVCLKLVVLFHRPFFVTMRCILRQIRMGLRLRTHECVVEITVANGSVHISSVAVVNARSKFNNYNIQR